MPRPGPNVIHSLAGLPVSGAPDEMQAQAEASARAAAAKAFALDPKSIDALVVMAALGVAPDLDFASAEKYARRAVELAPGNVDGLAFSVQP